MSLTKTISKSVTFIAINKYGKGAVVEIETVFLAGLPRSLSRGPLKRDFLRIYLTMSFAVRPFGNT